MTSTDPTPTIRSVPAASPEYARDYINGWRASERANDYDGNGPSPLERADARNVSHAWYDGFEDYAAGLDKWAKRDARLAGDHEPEPTYVVTFNPRPVTGPGAIDGLTRMTLADARQLVTDAARIPKRGRIVDTQTLAIVAMPDRLGAGGGTHA